MNGNKTTGFGVGCRNVGRLCVAIMVSAVPCVALVAAQPAATACVTVDVSKEVADIASKYGYKTAIYGKLDFPAFTRAMEAMVNR